MLQFRCDKCKELVSNIYGDNDGNWYCYEDTSYVRKEQFAAAMGELNTWKKTQKPQGRESPMNE